MLLLLTLVAHAATPSVGLRWTPLSRTDLGWIREDRTSGLAVGEFDGTAAPNLQAFGGAWVKRIGIFGTLGVARLQSSTRTGDVTRRRHWGVIRPGLDLRFSLSERRVGRPSPWLLVGAYGDIPSVRDVSDGYSEEEQELANESAAVDRARLGGVGASLGAGVDLRLTKELALGAMYAVTWHQATLRTNETLTLTSWLSANASLLLTFEWPVPRARDQVFASPPDS